MSWLMSLRSSSTYSGERKSPESQSVLFMVPDFIRFIVASGLVLMTAMSAMDTGSTGV